MKIRTLIYITLLLLIVNVAALVTIIAQRSGYSFDHPPREEARRFPKPEKIFSEAEREQFRQRMSIFEEEIVPLRSALQDQRRELFESLKQTEPDTNQIYIRIEEIGRLQTEIQKKLISRTLLEGPVLGPERRALLLRALEERAQGGHFWGKPWRDRTPMRKFRDTLR